MIKIWDEKQLKLKDVKVMTNVFHKVVYTSMCKFSTTFSYSISSTHLVQKNQKELPINKGQQAT